MFYNVENLFDIIDDPLTDDDEFTPGGNRKWNNKRYYSKLFNISKVIIAAGGWNPPDIIGLCEVENRKVLDDLVYETPLSGYEYSIVHADSRDRRGIDVALLYLPGKLELLDYHYMPVIFENDTSYTSRDILAASFQVCQNDTLYLFVNHWPSKYGGVLKTAPRRMDAAKTLRKAVDSLFSFENEPNILIMGDLNDGPSSESVSYLTGRDSEHFKNLVPVTGSGSGFSGTIKYNGNWLIYDHMLASSGLTDSLSSLYVLTGMILSDDFLMETDKKYPGVKPLRTFIGYRYNGGFSDHLPLIVQIECADTKNE
jgi:predicted extracellular nuclease